MKTSRDYAEESHYLDGDTVALDSLFAEAMAEARAEARRVALDLAYRNIEDVCDFADTPPEDARVPGLRAAMTTIRALLDEVLKEKV